MKKYLKHAVCYGCIIPLILIQACSWGKIQTKNYYIINYTPVSKVPVYSQRPYPFLLQIGNFEVQRIFNRQNILYRFSPHQIQYYELQQWAVRPDYMIKDMIFKHIRAANLLNRVGIDFFENKPDYRIEGTVEALEKLDSGDVFYGHLAMSFKMLRMQDGKQVWEYSFDERKQIYQPEMMYTVRGISSILQNQMDIVISQLDSLFLSLKTGAPVKVPVTEVPPDSTVQKEQKPEDLDESSFEIVPEKREKPEKK
jgi:ABC-type uncharacterized transport system auxiliary subunit